MARLIVTDSGARYEVRNGRITREAPHDVIGYDDPIVNEPFIMVSPPHLHGRMMFRLKADPDFPVRTSRVIEIIEDIDGPHCPKLSTREHTGEPGCPAGADSEFCFDCELGADN